MLGSFLMHDFRQDAKRGTLEACGPGRMTGNRGAGDPAATVTCILPRTSESVPCTNPLASFAWRHSDAHVSRSSNSLANEAFHPWQVMVTGLSIITLAGLVTEMALPGGDQKLVIFSRIDVVFCVIFLADFIKRFVSARNRRHYMMTWGWIDLLSSLPPLGWARWGRMADVIRLIIALRSATSPGAVGKVMFHSRKNAAAASAALTLFLALVVGALLVLEFEKNDPQGNIRTGHDAMWWAITTLTTVGYGDYVPVTPGGRVVGAVLMTLGIGLFAAIAGSLASWLLEDSQTQQAEERKLHKIEIELHELRKLLEEIKKSDDPPKP